MKIAFNLARIIAAIILLQTLFFKFTGAEESRFIFNSIGAEPVGRVASGVMELVAVILLFIPKWVWMGALIALGVISGAILTHLTVLGIVVQNDGGLLFALACIVFLCRAFILWSRRSEVPVIGKHFSS